MQRDVEGHLRRLLIRLIDARGSGEVVQIERRKFAAKGLKTQKREQAGSLILPVILARRGLAKGLNAVMVQAQQYVLNLRLSSARDGERVSEGQGEGGSVESHAIFQRECRAGMESSASL